jgi:hypothetical protein
MTMPTRRLNGDACEAQREGMGAIRIWHQRTIASGSSQMPTPMNTSANAKRSQMSPNSSRNASAKNWTNRARRAARAEDSPAGDPQGQMSRRTACSYDQNLLFRSFRP